MEKLTKERKFARTLFTKARINLENKIESKEVDDIAAAFSLLQHRAETLFSVEERVSEQLLNEDIDEEQMIEDAVISDNYRYEFEKMKVKYEKIFQEYRRTRKSSVSEGSDVSDNTVKSRQGCKSTCSATCQARRFRLPKIELRKFDGDVKNWIGFWGQFKKIDCDDTMDNEDKFQYLFQCTVPESPARALVESFPPSGDNYKKAIELLKSRFARDDLIIEIHLRELLNLVLAQAKGNTSYTLGHLFDKLNTQLQALQSLGITVDKYTALLFPLVESALPESVLLAWERSQVQSEKSDDRMTMLLQFLKREVESEERIQLSRAGLASAARHNALNAPNPPTASCLVATEDSTGKKSCIWCDKASHSSVECYKANKMSYESRKDFLVKKGGCFVCLKTGHSTKKCKNFTKCLVCAKRHSVLMCPDIQNKFDKNKTRTSNVQNNVTNNKNCTTLLQTFMVKITNNNKTVMIRAFIDSGSQRSYIRNDVVQQLNLNIISSEMLSHCLFGGMETKKENYNIYGFCVSKLDDKFNINMAALGKETICGYIPRMKNSDAIMFQLRKHNIVLSDVGEDSVPDIGLLIGADYAGLLLTENFIRLDNNVVALKTSFGWTLQGPINKACCSLSNVSINLQLTNLWDLETLGIKDPELVSTKAGEDSVIMDNFRSTVVINHEGRYQVNLPWKFGYRDLLDNKQLAEKRLMSTTQKLIKINELDNYGQVFDEWLDLGVIEEVDDKQIENRSMHYLPHHAVIKETSQTTRVRPVFDASARDYNGNSLNSFLEKGTNFLELIPMLLIKFRKRAIGITSDIKKAFLQISLRDEDRQYLSFLWWKNNKRQEIITYRHCRVVFGITSSPFLLGATIIHHLEKYAEPHKMTAEILKQAFYVDNCVTSLETEAEMNGFIEEAKKIMLDGKFELRGWVTAPVTNSEMTGKEEKLSVLGLLWNLENDTLVCNVDLVIDLNTKVTKRELLSIMQKVFDPLGVVSPVTLVPKLIIQKAWKLKLSWDKELPDDLQKEYNSWIKHIHLLNDCEIPRRLTLENIDECNNSLHVFCDASKVSFAAAIFLRSEHKGKAYVQLILAKSRVAPVREVTIPRLELMAALIATRLYLQVKESLDITNCRAFFWTDSSVALTWITTDGDWNTFVKNRVKEIRQHTEQEDWHHLPGSMNPADLPSRGCNAKFFLSSRWWKGPQWLKAEQSKWPKSALIVNENEVSKERRKIVLVNNNTTLSSFLSTLTYFSKYTKIVRMVGWILRFVHNCRNNNEKRKGVMNYEEVEQAEVLILKLVQDEAMAEEKRKVKGFHVFQDDRGIIRIRTKLLLSDEPTDFVCPIYLPGKHPIIEILVMSRHLLLSHAGSGTLITSLRESYWITGVRKLVKSVVSKCVICKRHSAKPVDTPLPPLPRDRVKLTAAFEVTGIDLAGPLFLRSGGKVWIVLFTCAVYRAIHLELTRSLSTESFLMALRRFIARRGRVDTIYTDNGTNFHGADNQLKMLDWDEIAEYSSIRKIKWKFSPPAAPWWGGWWERLVRSVKELLRRNLGQRTVTYEELESILCDCEAVINSRPLTYIAEDTENLKPLTPAHFLQGTVSSEVTDLDQIDCDSLNSRLRFLYKLKNGLRERFRKEYLAMLVQKGRERDNNLRVGDVVLVETESKRVRWPLGIILEVYPGRDGHPRVAKVRTSSGDYTRHYRCLYPLEIHNDVPDV